MLILLPDPKRTILETFQTKFERSKFSLLEGEDSKTGQKLKCLIQNCTFGHFDPLNGIFDANSAPCPKEGSTRDILS